ncbi:MAG: TIGR04282 family arsenosugar biosynthesis glycosyltransferase [Pirellulaceae bacterium]|nr:TIGR04282 family arsenosugar biosynthesis glycosyltransferase [Pirellulaceae bacterium]HJN09953.1 TIGR04282 family arsenosugar biosynthesis glycosyltransferase [Pirellulaceae bacterium]
MNQLGMFAKYWLPGTVKTRLARSIGDDKASQLYHHFVITLLARFQELGDRRVLAYSPIERRAEFAAVTPEAWELIPQSPGDLGRRMNRFFDSHLVGHEDRVVLIGTDSPTMPAQYIDDAFAVLQTHPVVLGPSRDGGYYLVGAAGQVPPIFAEIDWSTPSVWQQTVDRLSSAGCRFAELPLWSDVDDLADLTRIADELTQLTQADPTWTSLYSHVQTALMDAS